MTIYALFLSEVVHLDLKIKISRHKKTSFSLLDCKIAILTVKLIK